eukprot:9170376-Pyramimonas_sp.AAC.1
MSSDMLRSTKFVSELQGRLSHAPWPRPFWNGGPFHLRLLCGGLGEVIRNCSVARSAILSPHRP